MTACLPVLDSQHGTHSISYHSDDERFLGPLPTIASLSLGGSRDFYMRHKEHPQRIEKFLLVNILHSAAVLGL